MAFVVRAAAAAAAADESAAEIKAWANAQLGKTQRLSAVCCVDVLPRSAIGKVQKRELREAWTANADGTG